MLDIITLFRTVLHNLIRLQTSLVIKVQFIIGSELSVLTSDSISDESWLASRFTFFSCYSSMIEKVRTWNYRTSNTKSQQNLWMFTYIGFIARQTTVEHLLPFLPPAVVEAKQWYQPTCQCLELVFSSDSDIYTFSACIYLHFRNSADINQHVNLELIRHDTVLFSHDKSANSIFQPGFSAKRTGPVQKSVASSDSDANIAHIYSSIYRLWALGVETCWSDRIKHQDNVLCFQKKCSMFWHGTGVLYIRSNKKNVMISTPLLS